jgi:hypothetical protein
MTTTGKGLFMVLAGAALAVSMAACGSSGSSASTPKKPVDPLAELSGDQLLTKVLADEKITSGVRISGTMAQSGSTITMDMGLVRNKGCTGSMAIKGKGSFKLTYIGKTIWMEPDKAFYEGVGATGPALSILLGKYLKVSIHGV